MASKHGKDLALSMIRALPRLSLANIRDNPQRKGKVRYYNTLSIYEKVNRLI